MERSAAFRARLARHGRRRAHRLAVSQHRPAGRRSAARCACSRPTRCRPRRRSTASRLTIPALLDSRRIAVRHPRRATSARCSRQAARGENDLPVARLLGAAHAAGDMLHLIPAPLHRVAAAPRPSPARCAGGGAQAAPRRRAGSLALRRRGAGAAGPPLLWLGPLVAARRRARRGPKTPERAAGANCARNSAASSARFDRSGRGNSSADALRRAATRVHVFAARRRRASPRPTGAK